MTESRESRWRPTAPQGTVSEDDAGYMGAKRGVGERRCECGDAPQILLFFRHWCAEHVPSGVYPHLYPFNRMTGGEYRWPYAPCYPGVQRNLLLFVASHPGTAVFCAACGGTRGTAGEYDIR